MDTRRFNKDFVDSNFEDLDLRMFLHRTLVEVVS